MSWAEYYLWFFAAMLLWGLVCGLLESRGGAA
jgi:hypothetical protein